MRSQKRLHGKSKTNACVVNAVFHSITNVYFFYEDYCLQLYTQPVITYEMRWLGTSHPAEQVK